MNTHQKYRWNKLTSKRRRKYLKRRDHVKQLKLAQNKINISVKRIAKMAFYRRKYAGNQSSTSDTTRIL